MADDQDEHKPQGDSKPEHPPSTADTPLIADVSPDVAPAVEEFMEKAAEKNEAAVEAVQQHSDHTLPYISFDHVFKAFGSFVVLNDVSFFVNPGETLCILGRSGVGKSVSLQMLMGFLKPDQGKVSVAGEDITGFNENKLQEIRRKVTMVFQNGALFDSISVGENVAFHCENAATWPKIRSFRSSRACSRWLESPVWTTSCHPTSRPA